MSAQGEPPNRVVEKTSCIKVFRILPANAVPSRTPIFQRCNHFLGSASQNWQVDNGVSLRMHFLPLKTVHDFAAYNPAMSNQ